MHPSEQLIKEHAPTLAEEARELIAQNPEARAVGLILEAGAPEAEVFRQAIESQTGAPFTGAGFVGLVPREVAVQILRASTPAALEWLAPDEPDETKLPVAVMMKAGMRMGVVNY